MGMRDLRFQISKHTGIVSEGKNGVGEIEGLGFHHGFDDALQLFWKIRCACAVILVLQVLLDKRKLCFLEAPKVWQMSRLGWVNIGHIENILEFIRVVPVE